MESILTLRDIEFRRGNFSLAVESLALLPERIYLLEGPNGAGKSTLLHLLALLLLPEKGEIRFAGTLVDGAGQRQKFRRQITLVEQNPFLFDATVYQNLAFGLRLRDVSGDLQERRILQALEMVGLNGFETRRAKDLSGGETRRVALARALVLRPQLLLLDEPTADLDRNIVPIFERCLAGLPGRGTTIVIAGHDADMPRRLAGETIKLAGGRLITGSAPPPMEKRENA